MVEENDRRVIEENDKKFSREPKLVNIIRFFLMVFEDQPHCRIGRYLTSASLWYSKFQSCFLTSKSEGCFSSPNHSQVQVHFYGQFNSKQFGWSPMSLTILQAKDRFLDWITFSSPGTGEQLVQNKCLFANRRLLAGNLVSDKFHFSNF